MGSALGDSGLTDTQQTTANPRNKMAWHKGTWWPLYVKEWYAPKSSQHMFDPYSFCLIVLGLLFHLLWGTEDVDNWIFGFLVAIGVELILEIIGNSQFVLKRIRNNSGTSGEYIGDSIQNILGDLLSLVWAMFLVLSLQLWSSGGSALSGQCF